VKELKDSGLKCSKMGRRTDVHDEERSGWPSVMSDNLVQSERQSEFPQISCTVLYEIITG
jgi:gluconate kinase